MQHGTGLITGDIGEVLSEVEKGSSGSVIARAFLMAVAHQPDLLPEDAMRSTLGIRRFLPSGRSGTLAIGMTTSPVPRIARQYLVEDEATFQRSASGPNALATWILPLGNSSVGSVSVSVTRLSISLGLQTPTRLSVPIFCA